VNDPRLHDSMEAVDHHQGGGDDDGRVVTHSRVSLFVTWNHSGCRQLFLSIRATGLHSLLGVIINWCLTCKLTWSKVPTLRDESLTLKLLIPGTAAGSIIGKGGSTINEFQTQTGARIQLSRNAEVGLVGCKLNSVDPPIELLKVDGSWMELEGYE
jgi:hypothetical protein